MPDVATPEQATAFDAALREIAKLGARADVAYENVMTFAVGIMADIIVKHRNEGSTIKASYDECIENVSRGMKICIEGNYRKYNLPESDIEGIGDW